MYVKHPNSTNKFTTLVLKHRYLFSSRLLTDGEYLFEYVKDTLMINEIALDASCEFKSTRVYGQMVQRGNAFDKSVYLAMVSQFHCEV